MELVKQEVLAGFTEGVGVGGREQVGAQRVALLCRTPLGISEHALARGRMSWLRGTTLLPCVSSIMTKVFQHCCVSEYQRGETRNMVSISRKPTCCINTARHKQKNHRLMSNYDSYFVQFAADEDVYRKAWRPSW